MNLLTYSCGGHKCKVNMTLQVDKAAFLLKALWGDPIPCLFQLLKAVLIPWLMAPHLLPFSPPAFISTSPCLPSDLLLPSYKDPGDYIGPTWIRQSNPPRVTPPQIKILKLIVMAKSFYSMYSNILTDSRNQDMDIFMGSLFSLLQRSGDPMLCSMHSTVASVDIDYDHLIWHEYLLFKKSNKD